MARGLDKENSSVSPSRRNPFRQKIVTREELQAKREAEFNSRAPGSLGHIRASISEEERVQLESDLYGYIYDPDNNGGVLAVSEIISARHPDFHQEEFINTLSLLTAAKQ